MVKFSIVANNVKDPFARRWLLSVDNVPAPNWPLTANFDGSSFIENRVQGQLMTKELNLPDGKHIVYFAVSVPNASEWGTYSGGIQMDDVAGEFNGVDVDSVAAFEITVKGNKAVKRVNSTNTEVADSKISKVTNRIKGLPTMVRDHKNAFIVGVGLAIGASIAGVVIYKVRKGRRL